ncbi:MAG: calcium-binding protein [Nostoc sp.]
MNWNLGSVRHNSSSQGQNQRTYSNDTLVGSYDADTINGLAGNDTITGNQGDDTLTGGGGNDQFVYNYYISGTDTITDFAGVGKVTNPTAGVIAEADTLNFQSDDLFTARNLLLTQNGSNLEITFEDFEAFPDAPGTKVILQNFKLENLQNLKATGAKPAVGNILFNGETSITDSFHVFDANSTDTSVGIKNTVTFLNDLDNNITGLDDSDDVINGQGGNDKIDGKSGNDLLRGGTGNDTLIGGAGDDQLNVNNSQGNNLLSGGNGNDNLLASGDYSAYRGSISFGNPIIGNNTLNGGAGNDNLNANYSTGNNTLIGDAGDDGLNAGYSTGNNLLSGGAGNDGLTVTGLFDYSGIFDRYYGSGNNTLNGGAGNDGLDASYTTGNNTLNGGGGNDRLDVGNAEGNNLLSGGNGDDSFYVGIRSNYNGDGSNPYTDPSSLVTQTVDGGIGDDLLSGDYTFANGGITTTFNATTNISSITAGTSGVSYKNIEQLNIIGTRYDDLIVGSNGNDTLFGGYGGNDTIDGGKGDDLLSVDYSDATKGITTSFNATTNIGSITDGTNRVSYKNIEQLNITGTRYDDLIVGSNGNDTLSTGGFYGSGGNDTIDGGKGDDLLSTDYRDATKGITTSFNATSNIGSITSGTNQVSYKNIEQLNIIGTRYDDLIVGSNGNDTLSGQDGNDSLIGGSGTDTFAFNSFNGGVDYLDDFSATNELIQVSAIGFGDGFSLNTLETSQFTIGTSATTNQERFIYNTATGGLFFDQDGSASGFTQVQFAQLSAGLSLSENNFVVV